MQDPVTEHVAAPPHEVRALVADRPVNNRHHRFTPAGAGTDVTGSFRPAPSVGTRISWALLGRARGRTNRRDMRETLRRLRGLAEAP